MVTVRDVARAAGVSAITVSRVVNASGPVNISTRQRVEKAIADLHYVPNGMAKSLKSRQTNTLALVLTDITNPFWTTVARGVEDTAAANGYHVILCNTDEDAEKEQNYINILIQRRIDGLILAPSTNNTEQLNLLKRYSTPCVLIDRHVDGMKMDIVRGDNVEGGRILTEHLIGKGHSKIAIISGPIHISTTQERLEGYKQALETNGIPINANFIKHGSFKEGSSEQLVKELLALSPRPSAIVAMNNLMCIGALKALRDAGLDVPEDMALVSFDDIPQASAIYPFLTVCVQDAQNMGRIATELLMERIANKASDAPREIVLGTTLIVRESSGALQTIPVLI